MEHFIKNYAGTVVVALILLAAVFLAVRKIIKDRKKGKGTCGCGCEGCAFAGGCKNISEKTKN